MDYVPLQVKTSYSILESLNQIKELVLRAKELSYQSLAITDNNNMFGVMEFYQECNRNGIKPIIGIELNKDDIKILLYAKDEYGYKNLIKLSTLISEDNLDIELLKQYKDNLILVMPYSFYNRDIYDIYDTRYIGYSSLDERSKIDGEFKCVYINNVSYLNSSDSKYIDYLYMIKEGKVIGSYELGTHNGNHLLTQEELLLIPKEDIENSKDIAKMCNLVLGYTKGLMPIYDENINSYEYLGTLARKGLNKRLNNKVTDIYKERLDYELSVIDKMGFNDYFLIVYDYVLYAKKNNILVGSGRGSAAGSLVSYSLGITEIDPIKYNLLFERFLNPERVTMPDIDVDFDASRREEVIGYVMNKYGSKKAVGIITFNTLLAKQVLRDVGRVLNINTPIIDELTKNTLDDLKTSYQNSKRFKMLVDSSYDLKKLYDISCHLEGLPRHISIHAAGIVMSKYNIDDIIPLYKKDLDMYVTGYSMNYLESLGLLKMDFLSISNLTLASEVMNLVRENEGLNVTFANIPENDKKVFELFTKGDTDGIFQFESSGMKSFLTKLKVDSFSDIVSAISLYRPGPMDNIDSFIKRKHKKEKIDYIDDSLKDILEPTYGIIVYQEQIMQIAQTMAGYTLGEADILRRAMSKKKEEILILEKERFITNSVKNGYKEEVANRVYNLILKFANYGFNKSHAVSYSMIAYKMAFLKVYFYKYFMTSLLTNSINNENKTNTYILELRRHNIKVDIPDINVSCQDYIINNKNIVCPLSIIRNVGVSKTYEIVNERNNGLFKSFIDFAKRLYKNSINKRVLTSLILAGCFDKMEYNRKTLILNLDNIINYVELSKDEGLITIEEPNIIYSDEYSKEELIGFELEMFGFYLKEHPISKYKIDTSNSLIIENSLNKMITLVLEINNIKEVITKNNDVMAFMQASDEYSKVELTLFPDTYKKYNNLSVKNIIKVNGRVEKRYDKYQIIVNTIEKLN